MAGGDGARAAAIAAAAAAGVAARDIAAGEPAIAVAAAARLAARAGLVEAFGHVSLRHPEGGFVITSTEPLLAAGPENTRRLDAGGTSPAGAAAVPLEAPLHAEIYSARPDVGAIVRTHSPATVVVGAATETGAEGEAIAGVASGRSGIAIPVVHGLGGMSGEIALYGDPQLVDSPERGAAAAAALGDADCLIMRANGSLATGPALPDALVRAWYFEERLRVWLAAGRPAGGIGDAELVTRSRHWPAESARAWAWLAARFGEA